MTKRHDLALKCGIKDIFLNFFVSLIKGISGIVIESSALIADAFNSFTDILCTIIVLCGIKVSDKPADKNHPYGHEKIECVISFIIGINIILLSCVIIIKNTCSFIKCRIIINNDIKILIVGIITAIFSALIKLYLYKLNYKCAIEIKSPALSAHALDQKSDALTSLGSAIGIIGLIFNNVRVDNVVGIIIAVIVLKTCIGIVYDGIKRLVDTSCNDEMIMSLKNLILEDKNILGIDVIKTRQYGFSYYVDLEITLDKNISFIEAHEVAHKLHDRIEKSFSAVKHCMIHTNPSELKNHHHI